MWVPPDFTERRLAAVRQALEERRSISWLSSKWNITRPAATQWLQDHVSADDHKRLADNGIAGRPKNVDYDTGARIEIIAMARAAGWNWSKIADALGISKSGMHRFVTTNAADGIELAAEDWRDEEDIAA